MIEAGINDGDYAIIDTQDKILNNQIGAVVVDDEATLKRAFQKRHRPVPENSAYDPSSSTRKTPRT